MKKDTQALIKALSSGPVRKYLTDHEHKDLRDIILKNKEILGIPTSQIFEQIAVRKKAKEKLPLYYSTPNIIYPPSQNFEQSSSEKTARFKSRTIAELIGTGASTGVDLSAGFGVDTYFLSKIATRIHAVDPNQSLIDIGRFNHGLLGAFNIEYHVTVAEEFILRNSEEFDFVYIDPSRRSALKRKVVGFEDALPDIVKLAPAIFNRSARLIIKASPLLDLQAGISQLPYVKTVYVVSVNNECKELLFFCEKNFSDTPVVEAINLLQDEGSEIFRFTFPAEKAAVTEFGDPSIYLYEPNASILKAGAFKSVANRYNLRKLHPNTHLYTSGERIDKFPGRVFRIESFVQPTPSDMRAHFPDGYANVKTRNYPLSAEDLKKKVRLKDGGEKFLIGFTGMKKKFVAVATRVRGD